MALFFETILFRFFVWIFRLAEFAKLAQLQAGLDGLLVLACVIRYLLARRTGELDEIVLRHRYLEMPGLVMRAFGCGADDRV